MKKIAIVMLIVCGFCSVANAQIIVSHNSSIARIDTNGDGLWDIEVNISKVPHASYMHQNANLYNELGRCYVYHIWRLYEAQGINPASYGIPAPSSNANFVPYASYYQHLISVSGGAGMVGMGGIGGMGLPGTASVGVNIGGVNVGLNIPVTNANNNGLGGILTPNASVGVNVNGNGGYVSLPVGVKIGKKSRSSRKATTTTTVPVAKQMTVEEIQSMLNGSYM